MKIEFKRTDRSIIYANSQWTMMDNLLVQLVPMSHSHGAHGEETPSPSFNLGQTIRIDGAKKYIRQLKMTRFFETDTAVFMYELADGEPSELLEWLVITG